MKVNYERKLDEEILTRIEELGKIEIGGEVDKQAIEGLSKLIHESAELKKLQIQEENMRDQRDIDYQVKLQEIEFQKKDQKTKNLLTGLGIGLPVGGALIGLGVSLYIEFFRTENQTSTAGRNIMNALTKFRL